MQAAHWSWKSVDYLNKSTKYLVGIDYKVSILIQLMLGLLCVDIFN